MFGSFLSPDCYTSVPLSRFYITEKDGRGIRGHCHAHGEDDAWCIARMMFPDMDWALDKVS